MGLYPFLIETVTISGTTPLSLTTKEVTDFTLISRAANGGAIIVKSGSGSGNGFVIDKGTSLIISARANLADLTAEGTNGDLLGIGYHK